jgi:diadenosine tetraphosphate (Ap4A) HIT family hydrolase
MRIEKCIFCEEIAEIKKGIDKYFVIELQTGYVVMSWYQYFEGYTIFVYKNHVTELHEIENDQRDKFLYEMSIVAEAVCKAFKPKKLNYAMLGNSDPHMHWHLIPRYGTDSKPQNTAWAIPEETWHSDKQKPTEEKLNELKNKLKREIEVLLRKNI